jgi:hypothetical protein
MYSLPDLTFWDDRLCHTATRMVTRLPLLAWQAATPCWITSAVSSAVHALEPAAQSIHQAPVTRPKQGAPMTKLSIHACIHLHTEAKCRAQPNVIDNSPMYPYTAMLHCRHHKSCLLPRSKAAVWPGVRQWAAGCIIGKAAFPATKYSQQPQSPPLESRCCRLHTSAAP